MLRDWVEQIIHTNSFSVQIVSNRPREATQVQVRLKINAELCQTVRMI